MNDIVNSENSSEEKLIEYDVKAGGVLFYRFNKNNMELLIIESNGIIEDFGGKTDFKDKDIYDTVSREVEEESNKIFTKHNIKKRLYTTKNYVYMKKSKYIIFLLKINKLEKKLCSEDFGDIEMHDNISRCVKWISINDFLSYDVIKYKLNFRLKSKYLFNLIKNINEINKPVKNLFLK
jgi:hypothetical protein